MLNHIPREVFEKVRPSEIQAYVKLIGYNRVHPYREVADIWEHEESKQEIVVPHTRAGDYATVVCDLITFLGNLKYVQAEERSWNNREWSDLARPPTAQDKLLACQLDVLRAFFGKPIEIGTTVKMNDSPTRIGTVHTIYVNETWPEHHTAPTFICLVEWHGGEGNSIVPIHDLQAIGHCEDNDRPPQ